MESEKRAIRLPAVVEKIGLRRSAIYGKLDRKSRQYDESFPRPVRVGGASLWLVAELDDWLDAQAAKRDEVAEQRVAKARKAAAASVAARAAKRAAKPVVPSAPRRKVAA